MGRHAILSAALRFSDDGDFELLSDAATIATFDSFDAASAEIDRMLAAGEIVEELDGTGYFTADNGRHVWIEPILEQAR